MSDFDVEKYREYFRTKYVTQDAGYRYLGITNGKLYLATIIFVTISAPTLALLQIETFHFYFFCLLPFYFIIANLVEYVLHRYPMHHKMKGLGFLFEHVTVHHYFYGNEFYYNEEPRDNMAIFLPLLYFFFISFDIFLIAAVIYLFADLENALFFAAFAYLYYLMYEFLHFSSHAKEGSFLKKIPFIRKLSQNHLNHHKLELMETYNFNITFPIFDKLLGTYYKA